MEKATFKRKTFFHQQTGLKFRETITEDLTFEA
jgi:hypothetical protein